MNLQAEESLREDVLEAILAFDFPRHIMAADHVDFILSLGKDLLQRLLDRRKMDFSGDCDNPCEEYEVLGDVVNFLLAN